MHTQKHTEPATTPVTAAAVTAPAVTDTAVTAAAVTRKTRVGWNPNRIQEPVSSSVPSTSKVVRDTAASTSLQSAGAATTDSTATATAAVVTAESVTDSSVTANRATANSVTGSSVNTALPRKSNTKVRAAC
jgi:hypothetical protein